MRQRTCTAASTSTSRTRRAADLAPRRQLAGKTSSRGHRTTVEHQDQALACTTANDLRRWPPAAAAIWPESPLATPYAEAQRLGQAMGRRLGQQVAGSLRAHGRTPGRHLRQALGQALGQRASPMRRRRGPGGRPRRTAHQPNNRTLGKRAAISAGGWPSRGLLRFHSTRADQARSAPRVLWFAPKRRGNW